MTESNTDSTGSTISVREISLPKGGGAIKGMSDSFQANLFSGAGSYSIPIPVTTARGLEPQMAINYSSGSGNSEFGLGFSLSIPQVSVNTNRHIPKYNGEDIYILDGEGELVKTESNYDAEGCTVVVYLPRIEASYSKIEQWIDKTSGSTSWKVVSKANVTTIYGKTESTRIENPSNNEQVYKWLVEEIIDAKGNKILFKYKCENDDNVPPEIYEVNRNYTANKYISGIRYGNFFDDTGAEQFAFELVFDYGEYDLTDLQQPNSNPYIPVKKWACRPDPLSTFRSGFEIRTYRLCQNVLLFHNFKDETGEHCLVKRVALSYNHIQNYDMLEITTMSLLNQVVLSGYRKNTNGSYSQQALPPVMLNYSTFTPPTSPEFKKLDAEGNNIPGYLGATQFLPVDLNGDGLPGFLLSNNNATLYFEPLGDGKYSPAANVNTFPIDKNLQNGQVSLLDLDGNGQLELLVNEDRQAGYYQYSSEGKWDNFVPFSNYPQVIDPATEMTDLNANGKTDMVLACQDDLLIYFSKGKSGYDGGITTQKEIDFPFRSTDDAKEMVTFANIFGDGLSHRVRVKNGLVECWPNLGYGKFGEKITLGNAPKYSGSLDSTRLFFADIDGSGTSDLVYIYPDRVEIFINQNGNSFSSPIHVNLPEQFSPIDQISFADVLGKGTSCLVFTKVAPVVRHYYYNFTGETTFENGDVQETMKPYLLSEINNNLGLLNQILYASSTKFALEDKLAGRPWVTKLRFPVQVVERTIALDMLSHSRYVTEYKYHDGFYDSVEKEFRGFGFVESWDTETFQQYQQSQSNNQFPVEPINAELYVPPVYTKTWYHTGVFKESQAIQAQYRTEYFQGDPAALNFPNSVFAPGIFSSDTETFRQAYGALQGLVMHKEVYANDQTVQAANPYTVEESNFYVDLKQAATRDSYAVFTVTPRESISYNYERNPDDPMIQQQFVIETDPRCGEIKKGCSVFLSRRHVTTPGVVVYPEQQQIKITANTNLYFNTNDDQDFRLRGVLYDAQQFELFNCGLNPGSDYFSYDELKPQVLTAFENIVPYQETPVAGILQARQLLWTQSYFWNEDQSDVLPLGQVASRALLHHQSNSTFTESNINQIFGDKVTDDILQNQGGYFFNAEIGYWQNYGLVQHYFKPDHPERFYLPWFTENSFVDPLSSLYQKTTIGYDPYYLSPVNTSQYLDNSIANEVHAQIDYTIMQPFQVVDINNNVAQVLFDWLGQVVVSSLFGSEDDVLTGGMTLHEYKGQAPEYTVRDTTSGGNPITFDDVLAHPDYYLQGASSYFFYDLNAYTAAKKNGNAQPVNSINLLRENYYHASGTTTAFSCQMLIAYNDGSGRSIENKQRVDPGVAISRNKDRNLVYENNSVVLAQADTRWLVSGRTVYNNKGKACETYLPYFSNTPYYETQTEIVDEQLVPPPTITHYDPLLRVIRIDSPKGFFSKVEFTPWEVKSYDEDDTVKDSFYYISFMANYPPQPTQEQKDEKDALDKAAAFYKTPALRVFDNTGSAFLNIQSLPDRLLTGYQETDIQGRIVQVIDPRLYHSNLTKGTSYYNFKYAYAMGDDKPWYTDSADAGISMFLNNIFGNAVQLWNANQYNTIISYDRMQRMLQSEVKAPDGSEDYIAEVNVYGESVQVGNKNLRGQIYQKFDQAGISYNLSFDIQGLPLSVSRQLAVNYKTSIDWKDPSKVELEADVFIIQYTYDALKRLLTEITPDGTITTNTYNLAGKLNTISLTYNDGTQQALVNRTDYNANSQRTLVKYQNGVTTNYTYEDTTQRLVNLYTTRTTVDKPILQNIQYVYDPVGNITRTRDSSFEVVFCNNQMVEPLADFSYNAVYQLLHANGRQHPGINQDTHCNGFKQSIYGDSCLTNINDETKLENYVENYTYDDSGNLVSKQHIAESSLWTQGTAVLDNCNRLAGVAYDAAGNMQALQLNNSAPLTWDYRNNLTRAGIIQRAGDDDDCDYYNYDSGGNRVRKVSERLANGGSVTQVEEKIYIGNYEVKRIKTISGASENVILNRQCLRVMDDATCIATIFHWLTDNTKREVDEPGTRSLRYQLTNNLGSVTMEVDDNAQIISYEEYFPYGGTAIIAGRNQQEVKLKDYRYSGKECDDTTGLYYYGARYYITWLGRWLNPDPSGPIDGLNLYTFVGGNPISFFDPTGNGKVDADVLVNLRSGRNAIQVARGHVPYAGNVTTDVTATLAESTARLSVARSILVATFGDNEVRGGGNNAINRAASAIGAHGGACNEFSALTHTELISHITTEPIIRVWDPAATHSFTLIGDPRATPASRVVVADAWPSHYQVATLDHTRWDREISVGHLQVDTQTPLVGAAQALLNSAALTAAVAQIPAQGQPGGLLPIYDVAGAVASLMGTAGTAGRDDTRATRNIATGETYIAFNARIATWNGLYPNDYSTNVYQDYTYYSSVDVRNRAPDGSVTTTTTRTDITGVITTTNKTQRKKQRR